MKILRDLCAMLILDGFLINSLYSVVQGSLSTALLSCVVNDSREYTTMWSS